MWAAIENNDSFFVQPLTTSSTSLQFVDPYPVEIEVLAEGEDELGQLDDQDDKVGGPSLWLLSVPLPVLFAAYLLWGQ